MNRIFLILTTWLLPLALNSLSPSPPPRIR
jgi:hypothetical protein